MRYYFIIIKYWDSKLSIPKHLTVNSMLSSFVKSFHGIDGQPSGQGDVHAVLYNGGSPSNPGPI